MMMLNWLVILNQSKYQKNINLLLLLAFEKAVIQSKSFLIALALVNGQISVEEASTASRLEVIAQIKRWGEVEDAHDVDAEDMKRILGAVAVSVI